MAESTTLIDGATAAVTGYHKTPKKAERTFQAVGQTTSGTGSAVVEIQGSNLAAPTKFPGVEGEWVTIGVLKVKLATNKNSEGLAIDKPWVHVRGKVASISGTGAAVSVYMGS